MSAAVLNLFGGVLIQKKRAEEALEASGMRYTIIRCTTRQGRPAHRDASPVPCRPVSPGLGTGARAVELQLSQPPVRARRTDGTGRGLPCRKLTCV